LHQLQSGFLQLESTLIFGVDSVMLVLDNYSFEFNLKEGEET
jgi:hypothetical protein